MRKIKFIAALVISIMTGANAVAQKSYSYQTVENDPMASRIYTLDNGLKVFLSVNKEKPRIQTCIAVRTGSKNDPAETTGLAHYLEHIMFKGTKNFGTNNYEAEVVLLDQISNLYEEYRKMEDPEARKAKYHEIDSISQLAAQYFIPNEYDKLMATIGAEGTNAFTSNDVTCYTEDIPGNEIENWAKIQSDRFMNMVVRGFHTELEAVYEEFNMSLTQDQRKLYAALCAKLYPTHPYGTQTTLGSQKHLQNPSIVNIKNYFNHWYVPNNVAICMAGDFDPDKTIAIIDKYFKDWKPGADVAQPVFPSLKPITAPQDTTVIGPEAETMWMGWRFEKSASLQNDTLALIGEILNNGTAGLIDINVNQKMSMLGAFASAETLADHSGLILGGTPKEGQSLEEVKQLLLAEIDKLKKGEFSEELIPAVVNNMKLSYYRSLDNNRSRAMKFVDAFIDGISWEQAVGRIDRIAAINKEKVVAFANQHLNDNYVVIYKRQGVDETQKKINKPTITPIAANRDQVSEFVKNIQEAHVAPIQPQFLDFKKDLTITETKRKLPVLYKQNTENDLFSLSFYYPFGTESDKRYKIATGYLDYLGTDKLTATQIKEKFYQLACEYSISVTATTLRVNISGLNENMPQALALVEDLLKNAKVDQEAYNSYVDLIIKARNNAKTNQRSNFSALNTYGMYGAYNPMRNQMSAEELKGNPQDLLNLLKEISKYEHKVLYYGPSSEKELFATINKQHKTAKKLMPAPKGKEYQEQVTTENEVIIAPYDAKNIYMMMYHNENTPWTTDNLAVKEVFNEYYGGGMNGVVFQEMREARGLAYSAAAIYRDPSRKNHPEDCYTYIITQNDKMMDAVNQFHVILNEMPASQQAFDIAKDAVTKRLASQRKTKFAILNAYVDAELLGIDYDLSKKIYEQLPNVTLKDIVDFEKRTMANKPYRYIILGNEKELDMKALEKIGTIKRLSTEEIFGY